MITLIFAKYFLTVWERFIVLITLIFVKYFLTVWERFYRFDYSHICKVFSNSVREVYRFDYSHICKVFSNSVREVYRFDYAHICLISEILEWSKRGEYICNSFPLNISTFYSILQNIAASPLSLQPYITLGLLLHTGQIYENCKVNNC